MSVTWLAGLFLSFASADIVVLATGERMDVESYEVQEHMVVVKTWDGRLRALPKAYVDVAATEQANRAESPEAGVDPELLERARHVCDAYGIRNAVSTYNDVLEQEFGKLRGLMTIQVFDQTRAAFRNAFDDERSFDAVVLHVAQNAEPELLEAWSRWLETPFARKMVALETADVDEHDNNVARRYFDELRADPARNEARSELIIRLDEARSDSASTTEVVLLLVGAFYEAGRAALPNEDVPELDVDALRGQLTPVMERAARRSLLYRLRDASDGELERYIAYWASTEGQRVSGLVNEATEAGARFGSDVAAQIVLGKRSTVP